MVINTGLTDEQLEAIIKALNSKIKGCSACGAQSMWAPITDGIVALPMMHMPFRTVPCVAIFCQNCGHVQLHNVFTLGLDRMLGVPRNEGGPRKP